MCRVFFDAGRRQSRHCSADISKISRALGYKPRVTFEDGMKELTGWLRTQTASDRVGIGALTALLAPRPGVLPVVIVDLPALAGFDALLGMQS